MKKLLFVVITLACLAPVSAQALEIPLPEFIGPYVYGETSLRNTVVDLGQPVVVSDAAIRLVGSVEPGYKEIDGVVYPWWADFSVIFSDEFPFSPSASFYVSEEGVFDVTVPFEFFWGGDWGFFDDGVAAMAIQFTPHFIGPVVGEDDVEVYPIGEIQSATLIIHQPVATESMSLSAVKALYR